MYNQAKEYYDGLATFRKKRNRCRDYTYGRQWNDIIEVDGRRVTEYEYILSEGNVPLKNNLIRRIVRNVIGVFRSRLPEIMEKSYGEDLMNIARQNSLDELFCRTLEEFLISGMAIHRKRLAAIHGKPGVRTEIVSPGCFFFNTDSRDVRGWDIDMVGQVHRVTFNDWCRAFVRDRDGYVRAGALFDGGVKSVNVMEIWRREIRPDFRVRHRKDGSAAFRDIWRYYFLNEKGETLLCGDSPYLDGSHPYVFKFYPYLDGEIQSFVGDLIDQQRYTNRLITLYDWVIRASAKGVLLVPEDSISPGNLRNMADQWSRFNGVIVYKPKIGMPEPKQISGNISNLGISELLEIQLKMMEDVSGVNGILRGNASGGNMSGTLYESQTANAMYSMADLLETFQAFIRDNAAKDRMLFTQSHS